MTTPQRAAVNLPNGTLRAILTAANVDGVSSAVTGVLLENAIRLDAPPGSVLFNQAVLFAPPVQFFAEGQLNFLGQRLFPSQFDLSQSALAAASSRDSWSRDTGDRSMSAAGASGRVYLSEDLAAETEDRPEKKKKAVTPDAD